MRFTRDEKRTVKQVFDKLLRKRYTELTMLFDEKTVLAMSKLCNKLSHEQYCDEHHIRYEDMTVEDFERAMYEEVARDQQMVHDAWLAQYD